MNGVTTDANGVPRELAPRTFTSFSQAAEENGQSRIYLGIHWAFDKTAGIACGDKIADYIFRHDMQPLRRGLFIGNAHTMQTAYFIGLRDMWLLGQQDGIHRKVAKINPIVFHT